MYLHFKDVIGAVTKETVEEGIENEINENKTKQNKIKGKKRKGKERKIKLN